MDPAATEEDIGNIVKRTFCLARRYLNRDENLDPKYVVDTLPEEEKRLLALRKLYPNWGPVFVDIINNIKKHKKYGKIYECAVHDLQRAVELVVFESAFRVNLSRYYG